MRSPSGSQTGRRGKTSLPVLKFSLARCAPSQNAAEGQLEPRKKKRMKKSGQTRKGNHAYLALNQKKKVFSATATQGNQDLSGSQGEKRSQGDTNQKLGQKRKRAQANKRAT